MTVLSASQQQAIDKLEKLRVGALFMEPGTGKTLTAIQLVESSQADFVLWIVPFQTKNNLKDELTKWGFDKPHQIVGVESIGASDRIYMDLYNKLDKYNRVFIVVDESLKIKNVYAKRTQRVIKLGQKAYYKLILNGTPLSKNILDLYSQMTFLSPKILKMDKNAFMNKFCEYTKIQKNHATIKTFISGYANLEYLYSLIEPYVFDSKLNLNVGSNEKRKDYWVYDDKLYQKLKDKLIEHIEEMSDVSVLGTFQEMQQSYSLDDDKLRALDELMKDEVEDDKTIIFVKFIATREELQERYPKALVLTYGKGSLGLNLQRYKYTIFYDKTWNYATLEQSKRRTYRMGQKEDVTYWYLDGDVGLESMMNHNISGKGSLLKSFKAASQHKKKEQLKKLL